MEQSSDANNAESNLITSVSGFDGSNAVSSRFQLNGDGASPNNYYRLMHRNYDGSLACAEPELSGISADKCLPTITVRFELVPRRVRRGWDRISVQVLYEVGNRLCTTLRTKKNVDDPSKTAPETLTRQLRGSTLSAATSILFRGHFHFVPLG